MGSPSWVPDWSELSARPITLSSFFGSDFGTLNIALVDQRKIKELSIEYKEDGLEKFIQCGGRASGHALNVCEGPITSIRIQAEFLGGFFDEQITLNSVLQRDLLPPWQPHTLFGGAPDVFEYSIFKSGTSWEDWVELKLAKDILRKLRNDPAYLVPQKIFDMRSQMGTELSTFLLSKKAKQINRIRIQYWKSNMRYELSSSPSLYDLYCFLSWDSFWYVKGINKVLFLSETEPGK